MPRTSLGLQRSLYQQQQKEISERLEDTSATFSAYERRYKRATRRFRRVIDLTEVYNRMAQVDIVYVGDYHTLRVAQRTYVELVQRALENRRRRVVLALEFVEGKHQATLDAWLSGRIRSQTFLNRIGHPKRGSFDIWRGFEPILELARRRKLQVIAIDRRASLVQRDAYAAKRIISAATAVDRPLVLTLIGQFHVAPVHLPRLVRQASGLNHLVIYQNAENLWWRLARAGLVETTRAVEMSRNELCILSASPVVCQRSFLDYVDAESGDAPIEESGLLRTFRHLIRDIGRLVGVRVTQSQLAKITILTAGDLSALEQLKNRGQFTAGELADLRRHVLTRESAWIPKAKAAWLGSMSLNHASEEAAHCVRFLAVQNDMHRARPREQAFWARCLEEALGFFGSRQVNPARRCITLNEWALHFERNTGETQRIAAFVLALTASLHQADSAAARQVVPVRSSPLFHAVSHALGYLLGDAFATAFAQKRVQPREVHMLFTDRFDAPQRTFREWMLRLSPGATPQRDTLKHSLKGR